MCRVASSQQETEGHPPLVGDIAPVVASRGHLEVVYVPARQCLSWETTQREYSGHFLGHTAAPQLSHPVVQNYPQDPEADDPPSDGSSGRQQTPAVPHASATHLLRLIL